MEIIKFLKIHFLFFFFSFYLSSCNLASPVMTGQTYDSISIGTPVQVVEKQAGKPYRITDKKEMKQYYYIERIQTSPSGNAQNTYILTVKEGIIVDKQCRIK